MDNVGKLTQAGLISASASLNQEDKDLVNGLSDQEVSALISVKNKLTSGFVQRNLAPAAGGTAPARAQPGGGPAEPSMGIVF